MGLSDIFRDGVHSQQKYYVNQSKRIASFILTIILFNRHGDIAARNILLTENMSVKISDFGLSRHLYDKLNYIKKQQVGHFQLKPTSS